MPLGRLSGWLVLPIVRLFGPFRMKTIALRELLVRVVYYRAVGSAQG
ncbi:hypothetical protein HMPREF0742_02638 [Rothia aeria F0184]|uniref:Uncharacterized protein n=1 Tax=Rothia aeria F0184 TaxID=888019 RepID=U7UZ03_9MICC|nr:hypothetical protein HMPREF0742_02638 [Rothia aeria F0184]